MAIVVVVCGKICGKMCGKMRGKTCGKILKKCWIGTKIGVVVCVDPMIMIVVTKRQTDKNTKIQKGKKTKIQKD